MNVQDLKDNRAEIIEIITERVGEEPEAIKEVMTAMVNCLGWNGIESDNVIDFTHEIIDINEFDEKYMMKRGMASMNWLEENTIEREKELAKYVL